MPKDEAHPDDPYELVGALYPAAPGATEEMVRCIIEEYVRLGWTDRQLWQLFRNPFFRATHAIYRQRGEDYVREIIESVRARWGTFGAKREGS